MDLHHKLSTKLCKENQLIATEDLAIKNLLKNPKLACHIADVAWGHTFHQSRDQNAALNILYFSEGKIPQEVRESTPKEEDAISEVSSEIKAVRNT